MRDKDKRGVFVGDLADNVTEVELRKEFASCGTIVDCRIIRDEKGRSKKFGFINFLSDTGRINALHSMNGAFINGAQVNVRDKRYKDSDKIVVKLGGRPHDIYCGNIPEDSTVDKIKQELQSLYSIFNFVNVRIMKQGYYCFISFTSPADALIAVETIRAQPWKMFLGKTVVVQNFYRRGDSTDSTPSQSYEPYVPENQGLTVRELEMVEKSKRTLYVGNLPASLGADEKRLSEVFEKLVEVKRVMIVRDEVTGLSNGFIELSSPDLAESVVQRAAELVIDNTQLSVQISKPPKEIQALQPSYLMQPQYFQDPATGQYYVLNTPQIQPTYVQPPPPLPFPTQHIIPPQPQLQLFPNVHSQNPLLPPYPFQQLPLQLQLRPQPHHLQKQHIAQTGFPNTQPRFTPY